MMRRFPEQLTEVPGDRVHVARPSPRRGKPPKWGPARPDKLREASSAWLIAWDGEPAAGGHRRLGSARRPRVRGRDQPSCSYLNESWSLVRYVIDPSSSK